MDNDRKTYAAWNESRLDLGQYLAPGDAVDTAMVQYFLNVLPPAYWRCDIIQIGEPHDHVRGRETFATVYRDSHNVWKFAGYCWRGEIVPPPQRSN